MSEQPLRSRKKALRSAVRNTIPVNRLPVLTHGWLLDGDLRQLSPQTRSARRFLLEKLEWFLRAEGYQECGLAELRAFLAHVSTAHESQMGRWGKGQATRAPRPRTVHTYHGNLRTFFRWLVQEGEIEESPLERMRPPVARVDQIQPFTETQLAALLAVARRSRFPRRDEAIHLFLLDTGTRASELCGIRMKDLDLTSRRCTVTGKGNKRRSVYLNAPTVRAVSSYLRGLPLENGDPLFSSHGQGAVGEPLTRSGLFQLVERWGKVAELQGVRCSPHTYRHTFAVNFVRNGGNAFTLMQMLGHTSLTMSKRYVALAEADLESQLYRLKDIAGLGGGKYQYVSEQDGLFRRISDADDLDDPLIAKRIFAIDTLVSQRPPGDFPVPFCGETFRPRKGYWKTGEVGFPRLICSGRVLQTGNSLMYKRFFHDFAAMPVVNYWDDTSSGASTLDPKVYVVQTATKVIERCMLMTTDPGDLVLDPTCGSGTTAYVAEQWGRRWITTDTSRVALALARTRLMAGRFPYYLLADSPDGAELDRKLRGVTTAEWSSLPGTVYTGDIKQGFVYKRVPHVTLKSIANNEEIDIIHSQAQEKLEPVRQRLNALLGKAWQEWEVPREAESKWPAEAQTLLQEWWTLRRERQAEFDASIARRADTEVLYDQPYEDPKRIRVTGPFTVESLSPHRTLSVDEKVARASSESEALPGVSVKVVGPDNFGHTIIENLKKAGVQNTKKGERLKFDLLEPYAGEWLQATGEYTDGSGQVRRVAVALGPEHGTVGPELVKEAAKEALKGQGFDLLVVCGFAFDAFAGETAKEFSPNGASASDGFALAGTKQFGKLPVLLARMNPDLAMGDELLKKTGAGNLFMVFGEPDILLDQQADGRIVVEIRGVDVYDPTTGAIRSSSTDDIACWFLDTDYNEESFFVRHAYFTGVDQPYEKLKRALRAEVDEAAWHSLYSTRSRPFSPPTTGKIAIKVINHYGDEVLKVFEARP